MEIKEKKVITEWELKSDVFNFNDKTKFYSLDNGRHWVSIVSAGTCVDIDMLSEDFGRVKMSIESVDLESTKNLRKLVELIKNTFEVKNAK